MALQFSTLSLRPGTTPAAVPLQKVGQMLQVAIAVPNTLVALDDPRFASGCQIQTSVALEDEIEAAVNRFYGGRAVDAPLENTPPPAPVVPIDVERRDSRKPDRRATPGRRMTDRDFTTDAYPQSNEESAVRAV